MAQKPVAIRLFEDGKQLMADGAYSSACPKLAESQRLDPSGGTILNLARCHQLQGKLASAVAEYREAIKFAVRDKRQDREKFAREHLAEIEKDVPFLTITAPYAEPNLLVTLDGEALGPAAFGTALPVDPGTHSIVANAPGRLAFRRDIVMGRGEHQEVRIDPLAPVDAPIPPTGATSGADWSGISLGAGAVIVPVGGGVLGEGAVAYEWTSGKGSWVIGGGALFGSAGTTDATGDRVNISILRLRLGRMFGLGPIAPFLMAFPIFNHNSRTVRGSPTTIVADSFGIGAEPGLAFRPLKWLELYAALPIGVFFGTDKHSTCVGATCYEVAIPPFFAGLGLGARARLSL